jgi:hypothetical protein
MLITILTIVMIMVDGKDWYMCAADGDLSCLLRHVAWISNFSALENDQPTRRRWKSGQSYLLS